MYTLDDYEKAKSELKRWSDAWDNYSGNNPNKYQADIKAASRLVRDIEAYLKAQGLLERTEREKLEKEIDAAFPNAKNKEIVSFRGRRYVRRYFPLERSRSGKTVNEWGRSWEEVRDGGRPVRGERRGL
jgi:hypothetical protein